MTLLRDMGFTTLSPSEVHGWLDSDCASTSRAVCLTFDDGYEDFLSSALPVLKEFGFKSTVYVPTGLVGRAGLHGWKLLTWFQIRELAKLGVNIGSHSVSHPDMKMLSDRAMRRELVESRLSLEDYLGREICDFSHPFAFPEHDQQYVERYARNLKASGYRTAMTTIVGSVRRSTNPLIMSRLPANDFDDRRFFSAKLNSSYDWLHKLQASSKSIRQWV